MFTSDEKTLLLLYMDETRSGTIENLKEMETYLAEDETDLRESADKTIGKLYGISDEEFEKQIEEWIGL